MLVFSIFLVIAPIVDNPKLEYAYSIAFMLFGASLYVPFVKYKLRLPFIGETNRARVGCDVHIKYIRKISIVCKFMQHPLQPLLSHF